MFFSGVRVWLRVFPVLVMLGWLALSMPVSQAQSTNYSLRFYSHGVSDIDRVKISIDAPARPADVGAADFTFEFWMKANAGDNTGIATCNQNDGWITANTIFDRYIFGDGDYGDFGIALSSGIIVFGVNNGTSGTTLCSATNVANGSWHHVAVTRASSGQIRIFVDGMLDGQIDGPSGDLSYRDGRVTSYPNSDPYLVIGAEKHDEGPQYPSYRGLIDEVRISNILRYTGNFTRPSAPFVTDANTVALYHFDEATANNQPCTGTVIDSSGTGGGPSNGTCNYGGSDPAGPVYSTDYPFAVPTSSKVAEIDAHSQSSHDWRLGLFGALGVILFSGLVLRWRQRWQMDDNKGKA